MGKPEGGVILLSYIHIITDYEILYLSVNIFCAILLVIFFISSSKSMKTIGSQKAYRFTLSILFVLLLSDSILILFQSQIISYNHIVAVIFQDINFFSFVLLSFCWYMVFVIVTDKNITKEKLKRYFIMATIPLGIELIILLINKFTPTYYKISRIDDVYVYERGPLFVFQYLIVVFYLSATSLQCAIRGRNPENYIERKKYYFYSMFGILPLAYGIINYYIKNIPVANLGLTFTALFVYVFSLNDQITMDFLTGLFNRRQIMTIIDRVIKGATDSKIPCLYMIDANKFKSINDTYGHLEGDSALIHISEALYIAIDGFDKKAYAGRYGGDEFIVITVLNPDDDPNKIINDINKAIDEINNKYARPYNISLSIGFAKYDKGMNVKEIIANADEKLYKNKKPKKQKS